MSQLFTNVLDHLVIHWGICVPLFMFDIVLYFSGKWKTYKSAEPQINVPLTNTVVTVLLNQFLITFPVMWLLGDFPEGSLFSWENLYKIPLTFLFLEIMFFYSHLLLHTQWFYSRFHYIHHKWTYPMAISALYAHPFEHLLSNVLPVILAAKFTGLNFITTRVWHAFVLANTLIVAHGGYANDMHYKHHLLRDCNFGAIGMLDSIHNTYV